LILLTENVTPVEEDVNSFFFGQVLKEKGTQNKTKEMIIGAKKNTVNNNTQILNVTNRLQSFGNSYS